MTIGATSVEQIVNQALDRIGYPEYIGNIYDGTKQARAALNVYAQARDALLRKREWPFAFKQLAGVTGGAPPAGWSYSWTFPADCIRIRSVQPTTGVAFPVLDPAPLLWELATIGGTKFLLTQTTPIYINYIAQVTDPTMWDAGFTETLVVTMGARLGRALRLIATDVDPDRALDAATSSDDTSAPDNTQSAATPQRGQQNGR